MRITIPNTLHAAVLILLPTGFAHAQATWTVERTPVLDVSGVATDGTVNFGYAAGATRVANGLLLVADRADNSVRVIDSTGKLLRTLGRAGQGPNEFASIAWAGGCGPDSMLVWDLSRRQASMVGTGGIGRQYAIPAGDTAQMPYQFSCARNRNMVYVSAPRPDRSGAPSSVPNVQAVIAAVYRVNGEGAVIDRLGTVPGGEVLLITSPSGGRGAAPPGHHRRARACHTATRRARASTWRDTQPGGSNRSTRTPACAVARVMPRGATRTTNPPDSG